MMRTKIVTIAILACFVLISCNEKPTIKSEHLINKALDKKIARFKYKKRKSCFDNIYRDAERLVDSMISQQLQLDTVAFPQKPIRPKSSEIKEIPEALELVPIFK